MHNGGREERSGVSATRIAKLSAISASRGKNLATHAISNCLKSSSGYIVSSESLAFVGCLHARGGRRERGARLEEDSRSGKLRGKGWRGPRLYAHARPKMILRIWEKAMDSFSWRYPSLDGRERFKRDEYVSWIWNRIITMMAVMSSISMLYRDFWRIKRLRELLKSMLRIECSMLWIII